MKRLSRERLVATLQVEGGASVDSVVEDLRAMPHAFLLRDDNLLRRGRGSVFSLRSRQAVPLPGSLLLLPLAGLLELVRALYLGSLQVR